MKIQRKRNYLVEAVAYLCGILTGLSLSHAASAQQPRVPGYNVGMGNWSHTWVPTTTGPALAILAPGGEFTTFYDPSLMPSGTREVELLLVGYAIYEPDPCAVGAQVFVNNQSQSNSTLSSVVYSTGWTIHSGMGQVLRYTGEPTYTRWFLTYCNPAFCTSPCGPLDVYPDLVVYLLGVNIL